MRSFFAEVFARLPFAHYEALVTSLSYAPVCSLKPIAVLTDLVDSYTFFWLDNHVLYYYVAPDRGTAWGLLDAMLRADSLTEQDVTMRQDISETQPLPLAKRQCLKLNAQGGHATADLMDLEGFLDPEELRAARATQLLQEFMRIPWVAAARQDSYEADSSERMSMYG